LLANLCILSLDRRFITWLQGWVTWFSWVALLAGIINICANVTTVIVVASYPDFVVKGWHTVLVMYAFLITLGVLNMYAFWLIPWLELLAGVLHIVLWIVFAVVLLTLAPQHSSEFVFFEKGNLSGWNSDFASFNLGIVLITWGFVGFDAVAHVSEVCDDPNPPEDTPD
jgi:choline transport protein